ncbi:MAG: class I SAM-dependent methyltransferase [Planctomycetaceae bacterium]
MKPWHEEDRFWQTWAPALFTRRRLEATAAEVDGIVALTAPAPGARVLDMCCGQGRHALELARRGFRVTGVDRTKSYLEQARNAAAAEGLALDLVREDMRSFLRPRAFDLALNLWSSFGYFEDPLDDLRVARNLCEALAGGGVLVLEMMGKEVLARNFQERTWGEEEGGALHLEERRVAPGWERIESRWIRVDGGQRQETTFTLRLYAGADLAALLSEAGFGKVALFGGLDGSPYDTAAKRLVAVARKPAHAAS